MKTRFNTYEPLVSLTAIMVMIAVVVPVSVVAPCSRIFHVPAAALRLAAMFPVLAFRIVQLALGIADLLLAPSVIVVITIHRPCGNCSAQERQNNERRNECFGFLEHASLLGLHNTS